MTITIDSRSLRHLLIALLVAGASWGGMRAAIAAVDPEPLPSVAFLARADNPVDALSAGPIAAQLGAPIFLTFPDELGADARDALAVLKPDVIVLAGGPAALSETVEGQVEDLLPDATVLRKAGETRTSTAVALNELPAQLGFGRPVLTGATVSGDAALDGNLSAGGTDMAALEARVAELEAMLAGVSRADDLLTFEGMNVRIANGLGNSGTANGRGNLILGYGEDHTNVGCYPSGANCQYLGDGSADVRTGSHNLVIGPDHQYTSFGGIVAGLDNATAGRFATVVGGQFNTASGSYSTVTGGNDNTASGSYATVTGGGASTASGASSTVAGGAFNTASGNFSAVSGGLSNTTSGTHDTTAGGDTVSCSDESNGAVVCGEGSLAPAD